MLGEVFEVVLERLTHREVVAPVSFLELSPVRDSL
jgi:hypothetical protein